MTTTDHRRAPRAGTSLDASAPSGAESSAVATPAPGITSVPRVTSEPPRHRVVARSPLTAESLVKRGHLEPGSPDAVTATRLMESERTASRHHAARLLDTAAFWVDHDDPDLPLDREELVLAVAIALRTTTDTAAYLIRDAQISVREMPHTFDLLATGEMPKEWHQRMVKSVRNFTPFQRSQIDERIASWDLASIPADRYRDTLRLLISWFERKEPTRRPEDSRDVVLERSPQDDGTACLSVYGPIPEILDLSRRIDAAAKSTQAAQRHAIKEGAPIPFDLDGDVSSTGKTMSLADLRYAIITRTMLDTAGVEVPAARHRVNIVIPVLTMMGLDDAPATYDGITPLPAEMARSLAECEPVWHRVFTDPIKGEFLELPPERYAPTPAMVEHLRLVNPRCAAPGCTHTTTDDAENDHIIEFDHEHPERGGLTTIENFHRLHWAHHDLKTAKRVDPERQPDGSTVWTVGSPPLISTRVAPHRDLVSPHIATYLVDSWEQYQWSLELESMVRSGEYDRQIEEWGPMDPALDSEEDRQLAKEAEQQAYWDAGPPY